MSEDEDVFPDMMKKVRYVGTTTTEIAQFAWVGTPEKVSYGLMREHPSGTKKVVVYRKHVRGNRYFEFVSIYNPKLIRTLELIMFPEVMP